MKNTAQQLAFDYTYAFDAPWDNIEIERVRDDEAGENTEVVTHDPEEPGDYWSVYVHQVDGGAMCIADLPTEKHAIDLQTLLSKAVRTFKDNEYLALYDNKSLQIKLGNLLDDRITHAHTEFQASQYTSLKSEILKLFI